MGGPGRRWRQRRGWSGQYEADEYGAGPGEYGSGGGEFESDEYEAGEYEVDEYGSGPGEYGSGGGEFESDEYEADEYEVDEYGAGPGEYGSGGGELESDEYEADEYGAGPGEYESAAYGPGEAEGEEERFLPLIPIVGKVLGGLLGGLVKEAETGDLRELEASYSEGEAGEAEEELLGRILKTVLGREAENGASALTPAQEAEFASRLLEVADEQELGKILGGVVNAVGRTVQGISNAVTSPQGRALVAAVRPVVRTALASAGGPAGASLVLEGEMPGLDREQEEYEAARRLVQMTAAAAHDVATAPSDAPPRLVGELGVIRAAQRFAAPLFRRALRAVTPFARRYYGPRYAGFRRGPYGRYRGYGGYGGWRGYRRYGAPWGYGYRGYGYRRYGYPTAAGFPEPSEPPPPEPAGPPPPQPGFRWVAVPVGAPGPPPEPPPGEPVPQAPPPGPAPAGEYGWGGGGEGYRRRRGSTGPSGRWVRRGGKIIILGA